MGGGHGDRMAALRVRRVVDRVEVERTMEAERARISALRLRIAASQARLAELHASIAALVTTNEHARRAVVIVESRLAREQRWAETIAADLLASIECEGANGQRDAQVIEFVRPRHAHPVVVDMGLRLSEA